MKRADQVMAGRFPERGIKPFPGEWPTRWVVRMSWKGGPGFKYFGKPSVEVLNKVRKILHRSDIQGNCYFAEGDRLGCLIMGRGTLPYAGAPSPIRTSGFTNRYNFYHPNMSDITYLFTWMNGPWWTKRIKVADKIYTVYSEQERLGSNGLRALKDWITASGVLNG
jgi:hypothetical protein